MLRVALSCLRLWMDLNVSWNFYWHMYNLFCKGVLRLTGKSTIVILKFKCDYIIVYYSCRLLCIDTGPGAKAKSSHSSSQNSTVSILSYICIIWREKEGHCEPF